ncbi:HIRAN domain protein [Sporotomaculum syntrophicum]|uniref:HIRAN domain protein n=1 Tax=Sporotomaculum syntrophicum TaxID=182264 RepID=A0A9D3AYP0_9FIRM|nr:HIRAN domain-containing protein [Sporotomaculum syntrophicum]KAF1085004.1 HIRAN domain protein [Sporotomaculum syntrophicum]
MSTKDGKDFIYLIWKEPGTRRNYIVGQLSKNSQYEFSYGHEVKEAIQKGFELLIPFEDINKVYKSDTLFPAFTSRLPDKKRRGIEKILSKYGLQEYDEYKLLKKSGAKLPIDNLEFIDPIFKDSGNIKRIFYIAGEGEDCNKALYLEVGHNLKLELEPKNQHDKYAIKIVDSRGNHVGYMPRYYSESLTSILKKGARYKCTVLEVNKDNECVKVELELYTKAGKVKKIS